MNSTGTGSVYSCDCSTVDLHHSLVPAQAKFLKAKERMALTAPAPDAGVPGEGVGEERSFDFEQESTRVDSDAEGQQRESSRLSWGSEFDDEDIDDDLEVQADNSGMKEGVDMMHYAFWEQLHVIDDEQADGDPTGRFKYVQACQRLQVRPNVSLILQLTKNQLLLQHAGLRSSDAIALADGLKRNRCLEIVNLSGNILTEAGCALGSCFAENDFIEEFTIQHAQMDAEIGRQLGMSLPLNSTLRHLELGSNRIGDEGLSCIVRSIGAKITHLGLSDNHAGPKTADAVAIKLSGNSTLLSLDLSWNHLRQTDLDSIAGAIGRSKSLSSLWLHWNGVGDGQIEAEDAEESGVRAASPHISPPKQGMQHGLVEMLKNSATITDLDLSNCRIGPNLGKALAEAIRTNESLQTLKLDSNPLGVAGQDIMFILRSLQQERTGFLFSCNNCSFDLSRMNTTLYAPVNPSGHYVLNLSLPSHQALAKILVSDAKASDGDMWRCEHLDGVRFNFPSNPRTKWTIPTQGKLELDLLFINKGTENEKPADAEDFRELYKAMQNSQTDAERLTLLQRACEVYFFSLQQVLRLLLAMDISHSREAALVLLFTRVPQKDKLSCLLKIFSERARLSLHRKMGAFWFWNHDNPMGRYWLDLGKGNDRIVMQRLLDYAKQHPSVASFRKIRFAASPNQSLIDGRTLSDLFETPNLGKTEPVESPAAAGTASVDANGEAPLRSEGIVELEFFIHTVAPTDHPMTDSPRVAEVVAASRSKLAEELQLEIAKHTSEIEARRQESRRMSRQEAQDQWQGGGGSRPTSQKSSKRKVMVPFSGPGVRS